MPNLAVPERLFSRIGTLEEEGGTRFLRTKKSEAGAVVFGPYQLLGPGRYSVKFDIKPDEDADHNAVCCEIDVYIHPRIIFARKLSVRELRESGGKMEVEFFVREHGRAEYRVISTGTAGLRVAYDGRLAAGIFDDASELRFLASGRATNEHAKRIFEQNYPSISFFSQFGLTCQVGNRVVAAKDGVMVHVDAIEDMQLINEVFFMHIYNFSFPKNCIVIDVGMNVGMAALFFATMSHVEKVYGFEPFRAPYLRAMDNFQLNPILSMKIKTNNFGLSNKFEELDVLAEELQTIGTSIRGTGSGQHERIQVRDAGAELKELIADAAIRGIGVVIKIDCEGSEFPIFESILREDLLKGIDAMMIEWHKWWSKEKTQLDLMLPLTRAGFLVFDQTDPTNRFAGMLYAVKTGQFSDSSQSRRPFD